MLHRFFECNFLLCKTAVITRSGVFEAEVILSRTGAFIHPLSCVNSCEIRCWEVHETCYLIILVGFFPPTSWLLDQRRQGLTSTDSVHSLNTHRIGGAMAHGFFLL